MSPRTVVDASAIVDYLLGGRPGTPLSVSFHDRSTEVVAPALCDPEVIHAIRSFVLGGKIDADTGWVLVQDYADLPILRTDHEPFLFRMFELRDTLTAYDAAYLAVAEAFGAPLVTADRRLAKAARRIGSVEVISV